MDKLFYITERQSPSRISFSSAGGGELKRQKKAVWYIYVYMIHE